MKKFFDFGNKLHSGEVSIPFVRKRKLWLGLAALLTVLSLMVPVVRGMAGAEPFNLGIAFTGGSEFQVDHVDSSAEAQANKAVTDAVPGAEPRTVPTSNDSLKIETRQLNDDEMQKVRDSLIESFEVSAENVTSNFVGPLWGQNITKKMTLALVIYVGLALIIMALYFRTFKMSLAAIVGLFFVMVLTTGIYAATGFEITPEAIIGFLTVLSFSLYDTVVVFDKIRETTKGFEDNRKQTFSSLVELGVNQTTVRSINTTAIGALPIGAILFIGVFLLGAGTLTDIALSLFVGTIVATVSTLFVASPLYAVLRGTEEKVREQERLVRETAKASTEKEPVAS